MSESWTTIGTGGAAFPLTRLSLLLRAADSNPDARRQALDVLCGAYWKPLYAFLRAHGRADAAAKDLVQGFYVEMLEKGHLARFDPARGRFRTYLLACLKGHVGDQLDREHAQRRGGGLARVPLDDQAASTGPTPEQAYDRAWALAVLDRAFERWKDGLKAQGKERWVPLVDLLKQHGYGGLPPVVDLARTLGVTEAQVRHFLHREAKRRLREEVLGEVREGTPSDQEAEEERAYLMTCVADSKGRGR